MFEYVKDCFSRFFNFVSESLFQPQSGKSAEEPGECDTTDAPTQEIPWELREDDESTSRKD